MGRFKNRLVCLNALNIQYTVIYRFICLFSVFIKNIITSMTLISQYAKHYMYKIEKTYVKYTCTLYTNKTISNKHIRKSQHHNKLYLEVTPSLSFFNISGMTCFTIMIPKTKFI